MIRIYNFARGMRGVRVMWLCEEMGLPYEVEALGFPTNEAYRAKNPLGSVPFLEDDGGVAINESLAMLLYIAQRYGPTPLLPLDESARLATVLQLTVMSEASLTLNPLMEAHFGAPDADKRNWSVGAMERRADAVIALIDGKLGERPFLTGEALSLADIAVGTAFGMWRGALGKRLNPRLSAYQDRIAALPAYQRAQARMAG